jgi:hypothetical protein
VEIGGLWFKATWAKVSKTLTQKQTKVWIQRLKPVILAIWEADLMRIVFKASRGRVHETLFQPMVGCNGAHLPSQLFGKTQTIMVQSAQA